MNLLTVLDQDVEIVIRQKPTGSHRKNSSVNLRRFSSRYEPGLRSSAWMKMRINRGQEFVIGGYTVGATPFDAVIFGYYDEGKLILRRPDSKRLHPGDARETVQAVQGS